MPKSPSNGLESQGKETEWERRDEGGDRASATHIQLADRLTAGNLDWREEKEAMEKVVLSLDWHVK